MSESKSKITRTHSVKVPRLYRVAAGVFKKYKDGQAGIKTLVYDARKKHPNVKAIFALVNECSANETVLSAAFSDLGLLEKEKPLNRELALILATELIFGKKSLPGDSKPCLCLNKYADSLRQKVTVTSQKRNRSRNPRWVRVNTLKTSLESVITQLLDEGFN